MIVGGTIAHNLGFLFVLSLGQLEEAGRGVETIETTLLVGVEVLHASKSSTVNGLGLLLDSRVLVVRISEAGLLLLHDRLGQNATVALDASVALDATVALTGTVALRTI